MTDRQTETQDIRQQLAHAYVEFLETGKSDKFEKLKPRARELGVDLDDVCLSVRESRNLAAHARAIREQFEDDPEMFKGIRPGLKERFLPRKK